MEQKGDWKWQLAMNWYKRVYASPPPYPLLVLPSLLARTLLIISFQHRPLAISSLQAALHSSWLMTSC